MEAKTSNTARGRRMASLCNVYELVQFIGGYEGRNCTAQTLHVSVSG